MRLDALLGVTLAGALRGDKHKLRLLDYQSLSRLVPYLSLGLLQSQLLLLLQLRQAL